MSAERPTYLVPAAILGGALGLAVVGLAGLETRWIVWALLGAVGGVTILAASDKQRMLHAIFVLSFQIDITLRAFYGYAGGEGLEFPLSFLAAAALLAWNLLSAGPVGLRDFKLAGALGFPIAAVLGTSFLSLLTTSEQFVGIARLLYELELFVVYCVTFNLIRSSRDLERNLKLLFVLLAMQSVVYFVQSAIGTTFLLTGEVRDAGVIPRPGGTISTNPAGFASAMLPILTVIIALLTSARRVTVFRWLPLLLAMGTVAIGLTYTRAAFAGLGLGLVGVLVTAHRRRALRTRVVFPLIAVLAVVVTLMIPAMLLREQSYSAKEAWTIRAGLMGIALNVIEAHPITGAGPGAYRHVYKNYLGEYADQWLFEVHNEFLLRTAETGIVGGLAFVLLVGAACRQAYRLSASSTPLVRVFAIGCVGGLVALIWQMQWVPWRGFTYNALLWHFMGLLDGIDRGRQPGVRDEP